MFWLPHRKLQHAWQVMRQVHSANVRMMRCLTLPPRLQLVTGQLEHIEQQLQGNGDLFLFGLWELSGFLPGVGGFSRQEVVSSSE